MRQLTHAVFIQPIPVPHTHERIQVFASSAGWLIEEDDGVIYLEKDGRRWFTRAPASCIEKPVEKPAVAVVSGKRGR
jgi:hypothetical protein